MDEYKCSFNSLSTLPSITTSRVIGSNIFLHSCVARMDSTSLYQIGNFDTVHAVLVSFGRVLMRVSLSFYQLLE